MRRLGGPVQKRGMKCHDAVRSRSFLMILRARHNSRIARIEARPGKVDVSAQMEFNPDASLASVLSTRSSR
jgi:hypothetical protein